MTCIKCGKPVSDQEMRDRYDELCKQGIIPKLVPMCKECRNNSWTKEPLTVKRVDLWKRIR